MKSHALYLYALDPTHVGAGGYRMGRVDLTILRDAATGLPKVPGSSINGAVRAAAIYSLPEAEREKAATYARATLDERNKKHPHSGEEDPVARVFGYAEGDEQGKSRIGIVSFRDAEILAFPVPTLSGPRWVTTPPLLRAAGCENVPDVEATTHVLAQQGSTPHARLNLGWLLLEARPASIPFPALIGDEPGMDHVRRNLVLVHPDLFPAVVSSNLETRTSVSIDFETGAAAEGLLFTYEATPRGTLFRGQVDFDDGRFSILYPEALDLVTRGLTLACQLGLGAMTTRGFGRMQPMFKEVAHANLEPLAAEAAAGMVGTDAGAALNLINKALLVVAEQGLYALGLFLATRTRPQDEEAARNVHRALARLLNRTGLCAQDEEPLHAEYYSALTRRRDDEDEAAALQRILLTKQIVEITLTFGRYQAKARG